MKWCRLPIGIEPIVPLGSLFVSLSYSISHVTIRLCWWTAQTTGKNPAKRAKFLLSLFCFPVGIDSVVLCGFKVGGFKKKNKGLRRHLPNRKLLVDTFSSSYQSHANYVRTSAAEQLKIFGFPKCSLPHGCRCVLCCCAVRGYWSDCCLSVVSRLQPVCPVSTDPSIQNVFFLHRTPARWIFSLYVGPFSVNPWDGCDAVKIPADQQFVGNPFWHQQAGYFFLSSPLWCSLNWNFCRSSISC